MIADLETYRLYQKTIEEVSRHTGYGTPEMPEEMKPYIIRSQEITYSDISHDVIRRLFIAKAESIRTPYIIDDTNSNAIDALVMYLRRDERFNSLGKNFSLDKGIMLRGPVGCGKTHLWGAYSGLIKSMSFTKFPKMEGSKQAPPIIHHVSAEKIVRDYNIDGDLIFTQNTEGRKTESPVVEACGKSNVYLKGGLLIDDLGTEPDGFHYQKRDVIGELLLIRYEEGKLTHATSNMAAGMFKDRYGMRVADRMKEMFNDIVIEGESRRK